jgi:hypothetical protein
VGMARVAIEFEDGGADALLIWLREIEHPDEESFPFFEVD